MTSRTFLLFSVCIIVIYVQSNGGSISFFFIDIELLYWDTRRLIIFKPSYSAKAPGEEGGGGIRVFRGVHALVIKI